MGAGQEPPVVDARLRAQSNDGQGLGPERNNTGVRTGVPLKTLYRSRQSGRGQQPAATAVPTCYAVS